MAKEHKVTAAQITPAVRKALTYMNDHVGEFLTDDDKDTLFTRMRDAWIDATWEEMLEDDDRRAYKRGLLHNTVIDQYYEMAGEYWDNCHHISTYSRPWQQYDWAGLGTEIDAAPHEEDLEWARQHAVGTLVIGLTAKHKLDGRIYTPDDDLSDEDNDPAVLFPVKYASVELRLGQAVTASKIASAIAKALRQA